MVDHVKLLIGLLYVIAVFGALLLDDLRYTVVLITGSIIGGVVFVWNEYIVLRSVHPDANGIVRFSGNFVLRPSEIVARTLSARIAKTKQINVNHCTCKLVEELIKILRIEHQHVSLEHIALQVDGLTFDTCLNVISYMKDHADVQVFHLQTLIIDDEEDVVEIHKVLEDIPSTRRVNVVYAIQNAFTTCTNIK